MEKLFAHLQSLQVAKIGGTGAGPGGWRLYTAIEHRLQARKAHGGEAVDGADRPCRNDKASARCACRLLQLRQQAVIRERAGRGYSKVHLPAEDSGPMF